VRDGKAKKGISCKRLLKLMITRASHVDGTEFPITVPGEDS
jgi:hypothetical protein